MNFLEVLTIISFVMAAGFFPLAGVVLAIFRQIRGLKAIAERVEANTLAILESQRESVGEMQKTQRQMCDFLEDLVRFQAWDMKQRGISEPPPRAPRMPDEG